MRSKIADREEAPTEVNISPLIDMVFILLIFFIVTTVFVEENGLQVQTPDVAPPKPTTKNEPFILNVTEGGAIYFEGQEIRVDAVPGKIIHARNTGTLDGVTIEAHPKARVAAIARLLDICQEMKVVNVVTKAASAQVD